MNTVHIGNDEQYRINKKQIQLLKHRKIGPGNGFTVVSKNSKDGAKIVSSVGVGYSKSF